MEQLNRTPEDRVKFVAAELHRAETTGTLLMSCPYCYALNRPGDPLCCRLFAIAALSVMSTKETEELVDEAKRITEQVLG